MIKNQWYVVLEAREVPVSRPVGVTRLGEKMVFWRDRAGKIQVIADRCCHRGASLSQGKCEQGNLTCPFHGFRYDGQGRVTRIPANGINTPVGKAYHVKSYTALEKHGLIWLWWGDKRSAADLPPIPFFNDLKKGFSYSTLTSHWPVHYSRAIENQLDVVHLPFVHRTTIGRGGKTLVHGPAVQMEGDLMTFFVNNVVDDGQTRPKKPSEMGDLRQYFRLQFQFPNTWQNIISDKIRIFAAFVPIDEDHSKVYIRYYQGVVKLPVLRELMHLAGNVSSRIILEQDRRVVIRQIPKRSDLGMDEKLIPGDLPIMVYRKHRAHLKGDLANETLHQEME